CGAKGDPHYHTFDGTKIDFMGTCNYVLLNTTCPKVEHIFFEVENSDMGRPGIAWFLRGKVQFQGITIDIGRGGAFKVDGMGINLPYENKANGLKIFTKGTTYRITTSFNLEIKYNGRYNIDIYLPCEYQECTEGLCGDLNGDASDDLKGLPGTRVWQPLVDSWGETWVRFDYLVQVAGEKQATCPKVDYDSGECNCNMLTEIDGCFSPCYEKLKPTKFFNDCNFDMCAYGGKQQALPEILASYASQCQLLGVKICDWRTRCNLVCPANSKSTSCVSECENTCTNQNAAVGCVNLSPCVEGCQCDPGFFKSGTECVKLTSCGCQTDGRYYKSGEYFHKTGCTELCECVNQNLYCEPISCSEDEICKVNEKGVLGCQPKQFASCKVWGDGFYSTYDQRPTYDQFNFGGTCQYCLSQTTGLEASNVRWFKVSISHMVVEESGDNPRLVMRSAEVEFGGMVSTSVIFQYDGTTKVETMQFYFIIKIYVLMYISVKILFNKGTVMITVPSSYSGQLDCLCANFNGDASDDITNVDGTITTDINAYGIRHQVGTCDQAAPQPKRDCPQQSNYESNSMCGVISEVQGPLSDCHDHIHPDVFVGNCVAEVCGSNGDSKPIIEAVNEYATECQKTNQLNCNWFQSLSTISITCRENSRYDGCASACPNTCQDPYASDSCAAPAISCVCEFGFVLDGTECILPEECGCTLKDGSYVSLGKKISLMMKITHHCEQECTCEAPNTYVCTDDPCNNGLVCEEGPSGLSECVPGPDCNDKQPCGSEGEFRYLTLDGKNFRFNGSCSYTLVNVFCKNMDRLNVVILRDPHGHPAPYFFARAVVDIMDFRIELRQDNVDGFLVNLPFISRDGEVRIRISGFSVKIVAKNGVTVEYDGTFNFKVTMPASFMGCTNGLAGNYNGLPDDDFSGLSEFNHAETFKLAGSPISCIGADPLNACEADGFKTGTCGCDIMSNPNSLFAECNRIISPTSYIGDCKFDACVHEGSSYAIEANIATYAKACAELGYIINWRQECDNKCPLNSTYNPCTNGCPNTCTDPNKTAKCPEFPCIEGCQCNGNMVLSGTECVPPEECGCVMNRRYYKADEIFYNDDCSELCSCVNGEAACNASECEVGQFCAKDLNGVLGCQPQEIGICGPAENGNFKNFDGEDKIIFPEDCTYTLSNTNAYYKFDDRWFDVKVEVVGTATNQITVNAAQVLFKGGMTYIDLGPGVNGSYLTSYDDGDISVNISNNVIFLETSYDLVIVYDGSFIDVTVRNSYQGKLGGICGNFNGRTTDDYLKPDGDITDNISEFVTFHKVGLCGGGLGIPQNDCPSGAAQNSLGGMCSAISDAEGPFSECHDHADHTEYLFTCLSAACSTQATPMVVEMSMESYAEECKRVGQTVCTWREDTSLQVDCPENSKSFQCVSGCPNTCRNPNAEEGCEKPKTDRCVCNMGYLMNDQGECVEESECGC
uniref:VWFD domain-containing protein n=1 Tax=Ciona savignyi TaxID=51511 RepID=H2YSU5_CIOSA